MRRDNELDAHIFEFHRLSGAARRDGAFHVGMFSHYIESSLFVVDDQDSRIGEKLGIDILPLGP